MINIDIENSKNNSMISQYIKNIDENTSYFIVTNNDEVLLITSIKYLSWDSDIFNKKIGLYETHFGEYSDYYNTKLFDKIDEFCKVEGYNCIFTKVGTNNYKNMHVLESYGYKIMDTIVTLKNEKIYNSEMKMSDEYSYRVLNEDDISEVVDIIDNLYSYGRFFVDSNLDNEKVNELYKNWIINEIKNEDVDVLGIEQDSKILGFISCKYQSTHEIDEEQMIISLVGISKLSQGQGLGKILMKYALYNANIKKIKRIRVGTQIDNIKALNLYTSCGFKIESSISSFHKNYKS